MNKWKNVIGLLGLFICAVWFTGCASTPVEEVVVEDEYKREKNGERVALVMVDETGQELTGEENSDVEVLAEPEETVEVVELTALTETAEPIEPVEPVPEVFSNTINLAEITSRIMLIKNTNNNVDINYQAIISLDSFYWGRELPKAGDTVTIIFSGTCNTDIPAPVYISVLGNGFGTRSENWEPLVSENDDDLNYILFAQDIKARTPFTATAEFTLNKDCENNMAVHIVYPVRKNTQASVWMPQR